KSLTFITCWEWTDSVVMLLSYEFPSESHEVCIGAIMNAYSPLKDKRTGDCSDGQGKEADNSFRPQKSRRFTCFQDYPWPNIVVEVAYSGSMAHVKEKAKGYWLKHNRAYDAIVVLSLK
ncbi:13460_t:CDS:2, partial [Acaulospora morrowiae]